MGSTSPEAPSPVHAWIEALDDAETVTVGSQGVSLRAQYSAVDCCAAR